MVRTARAIPTGPPNTAAAIILRTDDILSLTVHPLAPYSQGIYPSDNTQQIAFVLLQTITDMQTDRIHKAGQLAQRADTNEYNTLHAAIRKTADERTLKATGEGRRPAAMHGYIPPTLPEDEADWT